VAKHLADYLGRSPSVFEVNEHIMNQAKKYPFCMVIVLYTRFAKVTKMMRKAETLGKNPSFVPPKGFVPGTPISISVNIPEEYGRDQQWLTAQKRERHQRRQQLLLKGLLWPTLTLRITPIAALLH
jgi:hypothetical protein